MSARLVAMGMSILCALGLAAACRFEPDLSRFDECGEDDGCPTGYTCLTELRRCLPDCGAQGPCPLDPPSTDGGADAGTGADGGTDAGEPLELVTGALPVGTERIPYAQELQARGGTPPYTFQATEPLPEWLSLDGGTLSGTPPAPGNFHVAVEVLDQDSPRARAGTAYTLRVRPLLRVAGPGTLVEGYAQAPYQEQLSANGGVPPYRFTLKPGSQLPQGLSLELDGGVRGTPSSTGASSFSVQVTDSDSAPQAVERNLEVNITSSPLLLTLSTKSLPDGRVGAPYHYVLRVANNDTVTWNLESGVLPNGVGLQSSTGVLGGTPLEVGLKTVKLSATNGLGTRVEGTFTLEVHP
jgi:hypothetical protein